MPLFAIHNRLVGAVVRRHSRRISTGFTLVEMLVVVAIIGILAGLITAAALQARIAAKNAVIVIELKQLEMALQAYKAKFGEYPPDGTDPAAIMRHLAKAFPRAPIDNIDSSELNPFTSLTFWLGGVWDATNNRFIGFSADPTNPFDATSASRIGPFFEFDPNRQYAPSGVIATVTTIASDGTPTPTTLFLFRYWPQGAVGDQSTGAGAIAYFRAENGAYTGKAAPDVGATVYPAIDTQLATGTPHSSDWENSVTNNPHWVNPKSFQIFSSGMDVTYGQLDYPEGAVPNNRLLFPDGGNYAPRTFDDITNFSGGTLESAMP